MMYVVRPNYAFVNDHLRTVREDVFDPYDRRLKMLNTIAREAELRRNVIDRLISASLTDATPVREATLQRWRTLNAVRGEIQGGPNSNAG